jgi:sugar/nucleoside kinase (ribokinase family)
MNDMITFAQFFSHPFGTTMTVELYAIGNALVDQEFSVSDEFLQQQNLQKGTMQLADQTAQNTLTSSLNQQTTAKGQASGGSAANTTVAFAALGGSTFYACRVGNDELGDFYLKDLEAAAVSTCKSSISQGQTGTCMVMVTPDGERTMHTHLGITAELSDEQINFEPLQQASILYIEGYLATSPSARIAVKQARQIAKAKGIQIAISLSDPAMVQYARDGLVDLIDDGVDILFCNLQEALLFTQTDILDDALATLLKISPLVIITRGAEGAVIAQSSTSDQADVVFINAVNVTVLDTNGAGDAFSGAFLYALSKNFTLAQAGQLAAHVSAQVVAQFGPRLALAQYRTILQKLTA